MALDPGEGYTISIPLTDHFGHSNVTPSTDHVFMTSADDDFVVTDGPKRGSGRSRYPERLLQLFATLWRYCEIKMQTDPPFELDGPYCNRTVDTWGGCWPDTPAGAVAVIQCPAIPSFDVREHAYRECTEDGTWFNNISRGVRRVNYSLCVSNEDLMDEHTTYIYIFIGGFSLSLVMLILSLAIFFRFKQLRCERITIHKNLFISYVLTGVGWILFYMLVALDGEVLMNNPVWCRCLHVICHYFTVCNFLWMFCEGLYINTILVYAFSSGKTIILCCYLIGWVLPLVLSGIYAMVRNQSYILTLDCWIEESNLQWIMFGPVVLSIVMNGMFLINIVRLLVTKLSQMPEVDQTKKATRATLILVPLLGLQYLLLPVRPHPDSSLQDLYHICVALLTSTQGAFVSLMYCFLNGEVIAVMRRKYRQHRLMYHHNSQKSSDRGYSITDNMPIQHNGNTLNTKIDETDVSPVIQDDSM